MEIITNNKIYQKANEYHMTKRNNSNKLIIIFSIGNIDSIIGPHIVYRSFE